MFQIYSPYEVCTIEREEIKGEVWARNHDSNYTRSDSGGFENIQQIYSQSTEIHSGVTALLFSQKKILGTHSILYIVNPQSFFGRRVLHSSKSVYPFEGIWQDGFLHRYSGYRYRRYKIRWWREGEAG